MSDPRMRLLAALLCACSSTAGSTGAAHESLAEAALRLRPGDELHLVLDGAHLTWFSPISRSELPAAARKAADAIQPGGADLRCAREHGGDEPRYLVAGSYPTGGWREVLLFADGTVVERSHQVDVNQLPEEVARTARAYSGTLERACAVQGAPGDEWYRLRFLTQGEIHVLDCGRDGSPRRLQRIVRATIAATK